MAKKPPEAGDSGDSLFKGDKNSERSCATLRLNLLMRSILFRRQTPGYCLL